MAKLTVSVNGSIYSGWKGINISRSIEAISGVFSFEFSDQWSRDNKPWPLNVQDAVEIKIDDHTIMKGYIDVLSGSLKGSSRSYSIQGRDATSDLIDCSAPQETTEWTGGISIMDLANQLSKRMGIKFAWGEGIETQHKRAVPFTLERGEKIFEALDRMAARVGVLLIPDGKGGIVFTIRGTTRCKDTLVEGLNAKEFTFEKNVTERFSDYFVEGVNKKATVVEGWAKKGKASLPRYDAKDLNMKRYRPLYIQRKGVNDAMSIEDYASTEANLRAGKSLKITCTVRGWTETNGVPWLINRVVRVDAPRLGIGSELGEDYIIGETEFTLSDSDGQVTKMTLLPPDAFLKQKTVDKKKRDKKGAGWNAKPGPRPKTMPPIGTKTP